MADDEKESIGSAGTIPVSPDNPLYESVKSGGGYVEDEDGNVTGGPDGDGTAQTEEERTEDTDSTDSSGSSSDSGSSSGSSVPSPSERIGGSSAGATTTPGATSTNNGSSSGGGDPAFDPGADPDDLSFGEVSEDELLERSGNSTENDSSSSSGASSTSSGNGSDSSESTSSPTDDGDTYPESDPRDDLTGEEILNGTGSKVTNQNADEFDNVDGTVVREETVQQVEEQAVSQLNTSAAPESVQNIIEQSTPESATVAGVSIPGPFDEDDVDVRTVERDGQTFLSAELNEQGQQQANTIQQRRREQAIEQARNDAASQLQEQTDANLERGEDFTVSVEDGQVRTNLTEAGREAEIKTDVAAQSDQFGTDDVLIDSSGDPFISTQARKEAIAAEREDVSADDIVIQQRRTESGDIETQAVIPGQGAAESDPQTQLDRSVATFENVTGTDIPGEGDVIPNVDVSEEIESATGINVPTSQEISDGVQNQIDRVATGVSENEFVSGTADVATEVLERAPTDEAAAAVGASAAATPVGQIATSETAQDIADEAPSVEDVTQTVGASAAATPLGQIATSETAQDVADEVPSVDDVTRTLGTSVAASPAFQVASSETAQDVATGLGGAAVAGAAASPLGQIVGSERVQATVDDVLELGGEATDRIVTGGGQAAGAVGGALGTGLAASPAVQLASNDRAQQLPGQALGAGQDVVEALRVTDELGADSEAEARRQLESEGPVASVLRDTGLEIETELAQFTSDDADSVVADRVEESRREDALEAIQNGPAASPAPAIGRNPGSAIRGLNLAGRAAQSGQAARAAAGISGLIGGGVAVNELTVPEDSDESELTVGEATQDVSEVEATESDISELDVSGEVAQDVTEVEVPDTSADIDGTLQASQQLLIGEEIEREEQAPEIPREDFEPTRGEPRQRGPSVRERQRREDLNPFERTFPTGGSAVVGNETSDPLEETREQQSQAEQSDVLSDSGVGPGARSEPGPLAGNRNDSAVDDFLGDRLGIGPSTRGFADTRVDVGLSQENGVRTSTTTRIGQAAASVQAQGLQFDFLQENVEVNEPAEAEGPGYATEYGFGNGRSRPRRPRLPGLEFEDDDNATSFGFLATGTTFETGVLQDPDEVTGLGGGSDGGDFSSGGGDLDRFDQLL